MSTESTALTPSPNFDSRRRAGRKKKRTAMITKRQVYALKVTALVLAISVVTSWLIVVIFA